MSEEQIEYCPRSTTDIEYTLLQNAVDMLHHALDWCADDVRQGATPPPDILENRRVMLLECIKQLPPSTEQLITTHPVVRDP
jgi:hypothetical protein